MATLAILWLPISSHCLVLETAAGFESTSCCAQTTSTESTSPHENECATDACATVEAAKYKSSLQRFTVPTVDMQVAFELPPLLETALTVAATSQQRADDALARLPASWQFSTRTALPPRAPSLVS